MPSGRLSNRLVQPGLTAVVGGGGAAPVETGITATGGTITASRTFQTFGIFNTITSTTIFDTSVETSIISANLVGSTNLDSVRKLAEKFITFLSMMLLTPMKNKVVAVLLRGGI
jgi:hypothetical protein